MAIGSLFAFVVIALGVLALVLFVVAIVKWVQTDLPEIGGVSRGLWLIIILLTSPIGPAIFLYMLSRQPQAGNQPRAGGQAPDGDFSHSGV